MRPTSHTSAGASRSSSASRARGAAIPTAVLAAMAAGAKTDGALRLETEGDLFSDLELGEAAGIHHRDMVGEHERLGLVVRDVDEGRAEVRLQLLQLDLHVLAQLEIEGAERLIEQEQRRLEHETAGDRDALPLPARELVDAFVLRARETDALQHR